MSDKTGGASAPPDYTKLTSGELDELITNNLLTLTLQLIESGLERAFFKEELSEINGAVAELVDRSASGWPKEIHGQYLVILDERDTLQTRVNVLEGALMAVRQEMESLARGASAVLNDRGEEENAVE